MLVAVPRNPNSNAAEEMEREDDEFAMGNLLDTIDFDDLFSGFDAGDLFDVPDFGESRRSVPSGGPQKEVVKAKKSAADGKKKAKVDWTPELHRRFVQAVEQLGLDKAVPSKILEIMGIDCLTRHNVASHLQKYRSHRKHLLAREAEAAAWNQRRNMLPKDHPSPPWMTPPLPPPPPPTIGYPPPMTNFRPPPLHVWGHPSVDQSIIHTWPPADPNFWIPPPHQLPPPVTKHVESEISFGFQWQGFPATHLAGIPPPAAGYTIPEPPSDVHPSKESVDATIADVLSKPWLPLPLGLKPPSLDGVMAELQRQGVSNIPPNLLAS